MDGRSWAVQIPRISMGTENVPGPPPTYRWLLVKGSEHAWEVMRRSIFLD